MILIAAVARTRTVAPALVAAMGVGRQGMAATEAAVEEGAVAAIDGPATEGLAELSERNNPP